METPHYVHEFELRCGMCMSRTIIIAGDDDWDLIAWIQGLKKLTWTCDACFPKTEKMPTNAKSIMNVALRCVDCYCLVKIQAVGEMATNQIENQLDHFVCPDCRKKHDAKTKDKASSVDHPPHYTDHPSGIECIDIVRHMNFNIGNAIKYLWRHGKKEKDKTIEDLQKAIFYIEDEIKKIETSSN